MKKIEWHLAGMIDCDECGKETFFRCIRNGPDETGGYSVQPPKTIKCQHCGAEFDPVGDGPEPEPGAASE